MRGQRRRGPRRSAQGFFSCPPNRFVGGLRESTKVGRTGFRGGGTQQGNGRQASGRMRYSTSSIIAIAAFKVAGAKWWYAT
jgi:hypothetical protein